MTIRAARTRVARWGVAVAVLAVASLAMAQPASAMFPNNAQSSSGAYIQSAGVCGGDWSMTISTSGFEWIRVAVIAGDNWTWTEWVSVDQSFSMRLPLPYGYQNKAYVVQGADWTGVWDLRAVVTSFDRIMNGDYYSTSYC